MVVQNPSPRGLQEPRRGLAGTKEDLANLAGATLKHVRERYLTRRNRARDPPTFKIGDEVFAHHSQSPSLAPVCLQDPLFGPHRMRRIDGSRIHVRCSPRLGGELMCAPNETRHYHSPDELSWDEWRLLGREVKRIDLQTAANPEEADAVEEMNADEMAVDGYYVVAGIAPDGYKQGWKFLTLWDGCGLSEATWETMSAFIQPDGSIDPIFGSYLVENNDGQVPNRAETLSQRKKKSKSPCAYVFARTRTEEVASFKRRWYFSHIPSSSWESLLGHSCASIGFLQRYTSPSSREATLGIIRIPPRRLSCFQPNGR